MTHSGKKPKLSFREATKDMTEDEIYIYKQELSMSSYEKNRANRDKRGGLISDLHGELFSEAYDFGYDSTADAKDRKKGINPMNQEYTDKVNLKRIALGVSPLGKDGTEDDSSAIQFCGLIAEKLSDNALKKLIRELAGKDTNEMVTIIKNLTA